MKQTAIAVATMKESVRDIMQHYGKPASGSTKALLIQLHAKIGTIVFHRSFATDALATKALKDNLLGDLNDLMTQIAHRWMLSLEFSVKDAVFCQDTAAVMSACLHPDEPAVDIGAIGEVLKKHPYVSAMFYLYNAYPLGDIQ